MDFDTVEYLKTPLSATEVKLLANKLGVSVEEIVRTGEDTYKSLGLAESSEEQLLDAVESNPILMQRPIVVVGDQARVGRPPEAVLEILPK